MLEIRINNAKFFAFHGVLDYEKKFGNTFEVDISMLCNAGTDDKLEETVDYLSVYNYVGKLFSSEKFNLIETASQKIADGILAEYPLVQSVSVKIRKPNAPLGIIDSVEIINRKDRH